MANRKDLIMEERIARETLTDVADDVWREAVERANKRINKAAADRLVADAKRCLQAALDGIAEWLDAVYERGISLEDADARFLKSLDACRGLYYLAPGDLVR